MYEKVAGLNSLMEDQFALKYRIIIIFIITIIITSDTKMWRGYICVLSVLPSCKDKVLSIINIISITKRWRGYHGRQLMIYCIHYTT